MESPLIAEGPDIIFQRFQLNAQPIRNILQGNLGKIGLTRFGAEAGKLGYSDANCVVALG